MYWYTALRVCLVITFEMLHFTTFCSLLPKDYEHRIIPLFFGSNSLSVPWGCNSAYMLLNPTDFSGNLSHPGKYIKCQTKHEIHLIFEGQKCLASWSVWYLITYYQNWDPSTFDLDRYPFCIIQMHPKQNW